MTDQDTKRTDRIIPLRHRRVEESIAAGQQLQPPVPPEVTRLSDLLAAQDAVNRRLVAENNQLRGELQQRDEAITKVRELVEELKVLIAQQYRDALTRVAGPMLAAGLAYVPDDETVER